MFISYVWIIIRLRIRLRRTLIRRLIICYGRLTSILRKRIWANSRSWLLRRKSIICWIRRFVSSWWIRWVFIIRRITFQLFGIRFVSLFAMPPTLIMMNGVARIISLRGKSAIVAAKRCWGTRVILLENQSHLMGLLIVVRDVIRKRDEVRFDGIG